MEQYMNDFQETIEQVITYSFSFNHLLTCSSVHRANTGEKDYREKYMFFVSLIPGVQQQGGGRTYDFQQKINQKFSTREVIGLGFVLTEWAKGNTGVLPFTKFTRF